MLRRHATTPGGDAEALETVVRTRTRRRRRLVSTIISAAGSAGTRPTSVARPPLREDAVRPGPARPAYLHGWQARRSSRFRQVLTSRRVRTARLHDPAGGFYSAEDADSEGDEGQVLLVDPGAALRRARADAAPRPLYWGVTGREFEGATILNRMHARGDLVRPQRSVEDLRVRLFSHASSGSVPGSTTRC